MSPEEKLLQDNKDYFKMEVLNTKLRSSGTKHVNSIILKKIPTRKCRWTKTKPVDYESLITENKIMKLNGVKKTKKPRRSELMSLCDEAETFMFGESSRQSAQSAASGVESEEEQEEEEDVKQKKKRRTHAEVFINDNLDYYKLESTGTRLRSQSTSEKEDVKELLPEEITRDFRFSFQAVPSEEPWYDVFSRQDEGREHHFPVISDPANQLFLLPYELPRPLLPQKPLDVTAASYYFKRRKRLKQIIEKNHPRKSPRCHASTLAIMSSLMKRKRRSSASVGVSEPESSPKKADDPLSMLGVTDDDIEELALLDPTDIEPTSGASSRRKKTEERIVMCPAPAVPIEAEPPDVLFLVNNACELPILPVAVAAPARTKGNCGPRRRKKARVNRTGWDKVRNRKGTRGARAKSTPSNGGIEADNIMTSPRRSTNSSPPSVQPISSGGSRVGKSNNNNSYCQRLVLKRRRRRPTADYSWSRKR